MRSANGMNFEMSAKRVPEVICGGAPDGEESGTPSIAVTVTSAKAWLKLSLPGVVTVPAEEMALLTQSRGPLRSVSFVIVQVRVPPGGTPSDTVILLG